MIVGEAPGADEDREGQPFWGDSGQKLNALLRSVGLSRGDAYVTNAALCRPAPGYAPTIDDVAACSPYLDLALALVRPRVIVAFGVVATRRLLGIPGTLESLRGRAYPVNGAMVIPTWHPSAWNRAPERRSEATDDLRLAKSLLKTREAGV
jgi:DNA polymerase